jgi:LysM repeat protein
VKQGDILFDIAQRYNTTMDVLQEINDLPNPNVIFPGQELKIPRGSPPGT